MNPSRKHRATTAWILYAAILLALLACGLHHGQASGLQLAGAGGQFCSLDERGHAPLDGDTASTAFSCPLCSSVALGILVIAGLGWRPRPQRRRPFLAESRQPLSPRHTWPAANPRASPAL